MLDVHPAHHAATTWRDFFIHIATIVLGLFIAVGLEQTVEYIHHQHQLHDVRQGILADASLYLHDVDQLRLLNRQRIEDLNTRIQQLQAALSHHQQLVSPIYRPTPPTNTIRLGNFSAAKASGLVQLLNEDEINILSDAEVGVAKSEAFKELAQEATRKRVAFEQRFQASYPKGPFDFAAATHVQLNEYLASSSKNESEGQSIWPTSTKCMEVQQFSSRVSAISRKYATLKRIRCHPRNIRNSSNRNTPSMIRGGEFLQSWLCG